MTASGDPVAAAPVKETSFWEDLIDIYFQPTSVFRRRQFKSAWPALLFVTIVIGVIAYFTAGTMTPIIDAEFTRGMTKAMAKNPQITQELVDKMRNNAEAYGKFTIAPIILISMVVIGLVAWVVGKIVGSKQTMQASMVVAAWSYMPRVLGTVIGGVQALLMDPAKLTSAMAISLSPARFMNPDTANPVVFQLLGRFDLITIWVTVLLAIGLYVTGKVTKERAAVFGVLIWVVGSLPAISGAFRSM